MKEDNGEQPELDIARITVLEEYPCAIKKSQWKLRHCTEHVWPSLEAERVEGGVASVELVGGVAGATVYLLNSVITTDGKHHNRPIEVEL